MASAPNSTQTVAVKRRRWQREFHYRWVWHLRASPDALWTYAANTDRFNRDAHVPRIAVLRTDAELPNYEKRLRLYRFSLGKLKLVPIEWQESPFEWIKPQRFGVLRTYTQGPILYMRVATELRAAPDGGTELIYEVWAAPRNRFGALAIPFQIGWLSARDFKRAFERYDQLALAGRTLDAEITQARPALASGGRARLSSGARALEGRGIDRELIGHLLALIERGDEYALVRMRPYALAAAWGAPRRAVLELFLHATRLGLLDSRWELLCPLCRGAKATASVLGDIPQHVHCDVCHIDFQVNFDQSVELVFAPNPSVRRIDDAPYCVGGPEVTPHVVMQQVARPGALVSVTAPTEIGRYRVRAPELPGSEFLVIDPQGDAGDTLTAAPDGWQGRETRIQPRAALRFHNLTERDQLFILERMAWNDQAATAAEVTTLQVFRDLFSRDVLRADVQIAINSLTVMFTDLRDSTALYREIGDATAFGIVMNHFDVLRAAIIHEGGSVVKTNGDAVMAVFRHPIHAARAALAAQRTLAAPPQGMKPLALKVGLHTGSCIAVNLNERLDYFGSVVNMAARLESLSTGSDIVISRDVYDDPEVAEFFAHERGYVVTPFASTLKGFGERAFELWRITQSGL
jgi:class 3 adenylate cyclase